jgi:hypothetical protein
MIKKYAADSIASEMLKLLNKTAMENHQEDDAKDKKEKDLKHKMKAEKPHEMEDDAMDDIADYLSEEDEAEDNSFDSLDDEIQSMHDHADDEDDAADEDDSSDSLMLQNELNAEASDKNLILMKGLGKIEAGLRRKGESFAADLVRATAFDIQEDIVKEAKQKEYVLRNLVKMASNLDSRGESLAADLLRVTINKINR